MLELLDHANYEFFNVPVAKLFGLKAAVYLEVIISIKGKAIRKHKLVGDAIQVDRNYVYERTTLTVDEQLDIDKTLSKLDIIKVDGKRSDIIVVDENHLASIVSAYDSDLESDIKAIIKQKVPKRSTSDGKKKAILDKAKAVIPGSYPQDLLVAYYEWIDAVYDRQQMISPAAVKQAMIILDQYNVHKDVDLAINILRVAAAGGFLYMDRAINRYKEQEGQNITAKVVSGASQRPRQQSSGVVF